eukprot:534562_1
MSNSNFEKYIKAHGYGKHNDHHISRKLNIYDQTIAHIIIHWLKTFDLQLPVEIELLIISLLQLTSKYLHLITGSASGTLKRCNAIYRYNIHTNTISQQHIKYNIYDTSITSNNLDLQTMNLDKWDIYNSGSVLAQNIKIPKVLFKTNPIINKYCDPNTLYSLWFRIGGLDRHDIYENMTLYSDMTILDDTNERAFYLKIPNFENQNISYPYKWSDCVYSENNGLITFGGQYYNHFWKTSDKIYQLNFNNNDENMIWCNLPNLPAGHYCMSSCVINANNSNKEFLFACSGSDDVRADTSVAWMLDINNYGEEWNILPQMEVARNVAGCYYWRDKECIIVGGGWNGSSKRDIEIFNITKNKWNYGIKINDTNLNHRYYPTIWIDFDYNKYQFDAHNIGHLIYIAGGEDTGNDVGGLEVYDIRDNCDKWMIVSKCLNKELGLTKTVLQNDEWRWTRIY